jgi:hypothetical protein
MSSLIDRVESAAKSANYWNENPNKDPGGAKAKHYEKLMKRLLIDLDQAKGKKKKKKTKTA